MVGVRFSGSPLVESSSYYLPALLQPLLPAGLNLPPNRNYSLAPVTLEALFITCYFLLNKSHQEVSHV